MLQLTNQVYALRLGRFIVINPWQPGYNKNLYYIFSDRTEAKVIISNDASIWLE